LSPRSHFPQLHWRKVWSTNLLERVNQEIKRRTRVVGIFPNAAASPSWRTSLRHNPPAPEQGSTQASFTAKGHRPGAGSNPWVVLTTAANNTSKIG